MPVGGARGRAFSWGQRRVLSGSGFWSFPAAAPLQPAAPVRLTRRQVCREATAEGARLSLVSSSAVLLKAAEPWPAAAVLSRHPRRPGTRRGWACRAPGSAAGTGGRQQLDVMRSLPAAPTQMGSRPSRDPGVSPVAGPPRAGPEADRPAGAPQLRRDGRGAGQPSAPLSCEVTELKWGSPRKGTPNPFGGRAQRVVASVSLVP